MLLNRDWTRHRCGDSGDLLVMQNPGMEGEPVRA